MVHKWLNYWMRRGRDLFCFESWANPQGQFNVAFGLIASITEVVRILANGQLDAIFNGNCRSMRLIRSSNTCKPAKPATCGSPIPSVAECRLQTLSSGFLCLHEVRALGPLSDHTWSVLWDSSYGRPMRLQFISY